jgi:1-acyl-sn-glycerol-3-phosphate acyltransferase
MILLRSLVFLVWFYGTMLFWGLAFMPLVLTNDRYIWVAMKGWGQSTLFGLRWICDIRVSIEGLEHLPPKGAALFASKHQATLDTVLPAQFLEQPVFPIKYELTRAPVFGFYMQRMIPIKRETHAQALKSLVRAARDVIAKGRQIMIYPEGTRQELDAPPDYKPGIAAMYKDLNLPVTPIALNTGLVWKPKGIIRTPGRVTLKILPAIPPGLPREEFMRRLEHAIESESQALLPPHRRRSQTA